MASQILSEDISRAIEDENILWEEFAGKTVLVTGGTGLIGSAILRTLAAADRKYSLGIRLLAVGRSGEKARSLREECGVQFFLQDIARPLEISGPVHYIFHGAACTKSKEMVKNPAELIRTAVSGTMQILELARRKEVLGMVYLSSMEGYGQIMPPADRVTEDMLGYIDLTKVRSCYAESKRMCENMCACWHAQHGVPVKTARLAQTFGAGTPQDDTRVFAQFARSVIAGEDIVLHTRGETIGNYCYTFDAVRALLTILQKGENGECCNVANRGAAMTVFRMAELVADKFGEGNIKVRIEIPDCIENMGYAAVSQNVLDTEKIESLGWHPEYDLCDMYDRLLRDWRSSLNA